MVKKALLAGGCFWGIEARFRSLPGVLTTQVGYSGGSTENPCYCEVCQSMTGHAESVLLTYDSELISYQELLEAFFEFHDPTRCGMVGSELEPQYRSAVFYETEEEKEIAEEVIAFLDVSGLFDRPIITEVLPIGKFYLAEDYHQNYYQKHGVKSCS